MNTRLVGLAAAVLSGLFVVSTSVEPRRHVTAAAAAEATLPTAAAEAGAAFRVAAPRNFSGGRRTLAVQPQLERPAHRRAIAWAPAPTAIGPMVMPGIGTAGTVSRYVGVPYGYYDGGYDYSYSRVLA